MKTIKLLLVDDEKEFVETLAERLFLRDFGAKIAFNGEEALLSVYESTPDVILLDIRMPGVGGWQVLEIVKMQYPDIQIIVVSGHGFDTDKDRALASGAFAYMRKPVDFEHVVSTIISAYEVKIGAENFICKLDIA